MALTIKNSFNRRQHLSNLIYLQQALILVIIIIETNWAVGEYNANGLAFILQAITILVIPYMVVLLLTCLYTIFSYIRTKNILRGDAKAVFRQQVMYLFTLIIIELPYAIYLIFYALLDFLRVNGNISKD